MQEVSDSSMDSLSDLPDDVVFYILSFLPTKSSIRTSILSKRWRFQWAHVPCFGFTTTDNHLQVIMSLHNLVNAFHIGVGTRSNHELESWIETQLKRKVRVLVIGLNYQLTLPRRLFTCETLVYLRILDCGCIPEDAAAVCFPSLKKLELINVLSDSKNSLPRLLSGCPVLEELMIERIKVDRSTPSWRNPERVFGCLTSHLQSVTFVDFVWASPRELDIARYILNNGKVLKNVQIICTQHCVHCQRFSVEKRELIKILIAFFRTMSRGIQLDFVSVV